MGRISSNFSKILMSVAMLSFNNGLARAQILVSSTENSTKNWGFLDHIEDTWWTNGGDVLHLYRDAENGGYRFIHYSESGKREWDYIIVRVSDSPDRYSRSCGLLTGCTDYRQERSALLADGSVFDGLAKNRIALTDIAALMWSGGHIKGGRFVSSGKAGRFRGTYRKLDAGAATQFAANEARLREEALLKSVTQKDGGGGLVGTLFAAAGGALGASAGGANTSQMVGAGLEATRAVGTGDLARTADGQAENPLDPRTKNNLRFDATLEAARRQGGADQVRGMSANSRSSSDNQQQHAGTNQASQTETSAASRMPQANAQQGERLQFFLSAVSDGARSHICFSQIITAQVPRKTARASDVWNGYRDRFLEAVGHFGDGSGQPSDFRVIDNNRGAAAPSIADMLQMNKSRARETGSIVCEINL